MTDVLVVTGKQFSLVFGTTDSPNANSTLLTSMNSSFSLWDWGGTILFTFVGSSLGTFELSVCVFFLSTVASGFPFVLRIASLIKPQEVVC